MYREVSNIPSGIYLDNTLGKIQVVIPEETTNLVLNPSAEDNTTGYTGVNSNITRVSIEQRRGIFSLCCTPVASGWSGLYYGTVSLTAGELYTFSVDVKGISGLEIEIYFATNAGVLIGKRCKLTASGEWQRVWVTLGEDTTTTRRVYVRHNAPNVASVLCVDGLQVENKGHRTSYCDGDMQGYLVDTEEFSWSGTPHASTSTRLASTASGGKVVDLMDYVDGILNITGSEMPPVSVSLIGSNPDGYDSYLDSVTKTRRLLISCEVPHSKLRDLSMLFHSSRTPEPQPILLRVDKNGGKNYEQDVYLLKVVYKSGLEGDIGNGYWENIALEFESVEPMIYKDGDHAEQVTIPAFSIPYYVVKLTRDMEWDLFDFGGFNGLNANVYAIAESPDGVMYFGGNFTADGAGNAVKGLCFWNGTQFVQCDVGVGVGVRSMAFGTDGKLYFGGTFHVDGAGGALLHVGVYDPILNLISALGNSFNQEVNAVGVSPGGVVYFGGAFTQDGVGGIMNYAAYWNGVTLVNAGVGLTSRVYDIEWDNNGQLVVGGLAYLIGTALTGQSAVAYWDGTQYVKMGDSLKGTDLDTTHALGRLQDGSIIAISFSLTYPIDKYYIFRWSGYSWDAVGDRFHDYKLGSGNVDAISGYACSNADASLNQNKIVITVDADYIGDRPASCIQLYWDGIDWQCLPLYGGMLAWYIHIDGSGNMYFAIQGLPTTFEIAGRVTIDYEGTYPTYPEIVFFGEARPYSVMNVTTKDRIYFRDCIIQAGDYLKIASDNSGMVTVTNRSKGNFTGIVSAGSDTGNFKLLRGDNIISALAVKYNGATYDSVDTVYLKWRECFWNMV
jgi:hypothetical protein